MSEAFNEKDLAVTDFSGLLDFDTTGAVNAGNPIASLGDRYCPYHPGADDCACHGFLEDWDLTEDPIEAAPLLGLAEPDYSKFENYIPKFIRPEKPCDYCHSKRMSCYLQQGEPFCTPCALLFRDCSLNNDTSGPSRPDVSRNHFSNPEVLRVVSEDASTTKPALSRANSHPKIPLNDDAPGSTKANGIRFPKHAVKILRDWLDAHASNPYPTEDEKIELEIETELKPSQIANWLANARRRRKVTERSRPKLAMSPSLRPTTAAIPIPVADERSWNELNPLERWKNSPPENEPARMSDIAHALASTDIPAGKASASASPSPLERYKKRKTSSNGSKTSNARPQSVTSCETGRTSSLSASSAAFSNGSSHSTHGSFGSFNSSLIGKKYRRRRRRPMVPKALDRKPADDKKRIFQCTFCTDTFKSKYDWTRHEKSLHLSLEKWICAPLGPVITDQETGMKKCVYCDLHNPSSDHIESHNHRQCEDKGLDARTFYRKDHLRQHLRLMHACEMVPSTESWKSMAQNINSRCGFCAQRFSVWQERVDHLTAHFKAGVRMVAWKGCRGLDPAVAAQVTNAMPPYLIGMEAVTPNPFSATNRASWRLPEEVNGCQEGAIDSTAVPTSGTDSKSTCWEILTIRLGQFAKEQADQGLPITDDLLQRQARRILYDGDDDAWNQTSADNPEWLALFKKAHGLDLIPSVIGGEGNHIPEDLESYGDLGLRIPFPVRLRAFNDLHCENASVSIANLSQDYIASIEMRRVECRRIYTELQSQGVFFDADKTCGHPECSLNMIDVSPFDTISIPGPRPKRWCSEAVSAELSAHIASANIATPLHHSRPPPSPAFSGGARRKIMNTLSELDGEMHRIHGSCCPDGPAKIVSATTGGSTVEPRLSWDAMTPSSGSSGRDGDVEIRASIARARGLAALAKIEALEDQDPLMRGELMQEWYADQQRSFGEGQVGGDHGLVKSRGGYEFMGDAALQPTVFDATGEVGWSVPSPPLPDTTGSGHGLGERSLSQEEMLTQLDELIAASTATPLADTVGASKMATMTTTTACDMDIDAAWAMGNVMPGTGHRGDEWDDAMTMETMDFMMDDLGEFGFDDLVGGDGCAGAWAL
ncbi:unnamed protein product [Zymoseptoria tritici ST99CH_3D7]|uniref:Homeobox domain-containing protein n=1 Tax=Zymoseptoria tritici (strain ST99CH_3D7) TaxID=1276538 RepID=A0A1X7RDJ3_ZYMT9|nr:unnamed protein product [Zymoseptoria tritici ST99CH_3D7]